MQIVNRKNNKSGKHDKDNNLEGNNKEDIIEQIHTIKMMVFIQNPAHTIQTKKKKRTFKTL